MQAGCSEPPSSGQLRLSGRLSRGDGDNVDASRVISLRLIEKLTHTSIIHTGIHLQ